MKRTILPPGLNIQRKAGVVPNPLLHVPGHCKDTLPVLHSPSKVKPRPEQDSQTSPELDIAGEKKYFARPTRTKGRKKSPALKSSNQTTPASKEKKILRWDQSLGSADDQKPGKPVHEKGPAEDNGNSGTGMKGASVRTPERQHTASSQDPFPFPNMYSRATSAFSTSSGWSTGGSDAIKLDYYTDDLGKTVASPRIWEELSRRGSAKSSGSSHTTNPTCNQSAQPSATRTSKSRQGTSDYSLQREELIRALAPNSGFLQIEETWGLPLSPDRHGNTPPDSPSTIYLKAELLRRKQERMGRDIGSDSRNRVRSRSPSSRHRTESPAHKSKETVGYMAARASLSPTQWWKVSLSPSPKPDELVIDQEKPEILHRAESCPPLPETSSPYLKTLLEEGFSFEDEDEIRPAGRNVGNEDSTGSRNADDPDGVPDDSMVGVGVYHMGEVIFDRKPSPSGPRPVEINLPPRSSANRINSHEALSPASQEAAQVDLALAESREKALQILTELGTSLSPHKKRNYSNEGAVTGNVVDDHGVRRRMAGIFETTALLEGMSLTELEPYPIFTTIGTERYHKLLQFKRRRDPIPEDPDVELSDQEVAGLMEKYFKRHLPLQPGEKKKNYLKPRSQSVPASKVFVVDKKMVWSKDSPVKARLEAARNNKFLRDELKDFAERVIPMQNAIERSHHRHNHVALNVRNAAKHQTEKSVAKDPGALRRIAALEAEKELQQIKVLKEAREKAAEEEWKEKEEARIKKLKQATIQQVWRQEMSKLQRTWLKAIASAFAFRVLMAPMHIRRRSNLLAWRFMASTLAIQRWMRQVIWKKRSKTMQKVHRVVWRFTMKCRIMHKRKHVTHLIEFLREYKQRSRAFQAMRNFRAKVLILQRAIRNFLVMRRFRWLMLELQWVRFERNRNRLLRKEWRKSWNQMMNELSKVFKMPPSHMKKKIASKQLRWVTAMMDEMIDKMPENIKNITIVSHRIRGLVLDGEKKRILKEYLEDLQKYRRKQEQLQESKFFRDLVLSTFPHLGHMQEGDVTAPELQFLLISEDKIKAPILMPLLSEDTLERLIMQAQQITKQEAMAKAEAAEVQKNVMQGESSFKLFASMRILDGNMTPLPETENQEEIAEETQAVEDVVLRTNRLMSTKEFKAMRMGKNLQSKAPVSARSLASSTSVRSIGSHRE